MFYSYKYMKIIGYVLFNKAFKLTIVNFYRWRFRDICILYIFIVAPLHLDFCH